MLLDQNFFYSQHALNLFRMCPLRFKKRYIKGLYWRGAQPESKSIQMGRDFHILADRYFSNVPMKMEFFEEYGELNEWMDTLGSYMEQKPKGKYYPEYQIKIDDDNMRLQAKYDLVYVAPDGKITIYDWKTQDKPINYGNIKTSMQTRVYRYVMALGGARLTGGEIVPEDITMKYWQPKFPENNINLPYSSGQFEEDRVFLKGLIEKIEQFDYEDYSAPEDSKYCLRCEFNYFCNTDKVGYNLVFADEDIELDDWDDIDIEDIHF